MKRILALLLLAACLVAVPSALASWESFISTGSATAVGNQSCEFVSTDNMVCEVRSGTDAIMVNEFNETKWGT